MNILDFVIVYGFFVDLFKVNEARIELEYVLRLSYTTLLENMMVIDREIVFLLI